MSRKKKTDKEFSIVRSSAAEYLTFVAAGGTGGVEAVYADESIWLTQKMMGVLYDVETQTVNYHLKTVFSDSELQETAVIRNFRITAADGKIDQLMARCDELEKLRAERDQKQTELLNSVMARVT